MPAYFSFLRLNLADAEDVWEAAVWGRNQLDEESFGNGPDVPLLSGYAGIAGEQRTYGITFRYRWIR